MLITLKKEVVFKYIPFALLGGVLSFNLNHAIADEQYGEWSTPMNLGVNFNSANRDGCQYISGDGLTMYVASDRPGGYGGMDLYVSTRPNVNSTWGAPEPLSFGINSRWWEICPAISQNGRVLYFTSERDGGCNDAEITATNGSNTARRDIYMSTRDDVNDDFAWSEPVHLGCSETGGFNSAKTDQGPSYYEDKKGDAYIYFSSNRNGGKGGHDIYIVKLGDDETPDVSTIENVDELNTEKNDHRPYVRKDGLEVYFDSNRDEEPAGDQIYMAIRKNAHVRFEEPKLVENVAAGGKDINRRAVLANHGTELYYTANRAGGSGSVDVWVSTRPKTE